MAEPTATEDQAKVEIQAGGLLPADNLPRPAELILTPEEVAELRRQAASPGPWYTSAQVRARLDALQEEWERTGGFGQSHLRDLLARLDLNDPGHMRPEGQGG